MSFIKGETQLLLTFSFVLLIRVRLLAMSQFMMVMFVFCLHQLWQSKCCRTVQNKAAFQIFVNFKITSPDVI